jgi:hypothetical protein
MAWKQWRKHGSLTSGPTALGVVPQHASGDVLDEGSDFYTVSLSVEELKQAIQRAMNDIEDGVTRITRGTRERLRMGTLSPVNRAEARESEAVVPS